MDTEIGYVKSLEGDTAYVEFSRQANSEDDFIENMNILELPPVTVNIKNTLNASVGDKVELKLDEKNFLKLTFIVYGIPLIFMLLGLFIGIYFFKKAGYSNYELYGILISIIFLVISYSILSIIDKKMNNDEKFTVNMIQILND